MNFSILHRSSFFVILNLDYRHMSIYKLSSYLFLHVSYKNPWKYFPPPSVNRNKPENRVDNVSGCRQTNLHTVYFVLRMSVCPVTSGQPKTFWAGCKGYACASFVPIRIRAQIPHSHSHPHQHWQDIWTHGHMVLIETTGSEWCKPLAVAQSCRRAQKIAQFAHDLWT